MKFVAGIIRYMLLTITLLLCIALCICGIVWLNKAENKSENIDLTSAEIETYDIYSQYNLDYVDLKLTEELEATVSSGNDSAIEERTIYGDAGKLTCVQGTKFHKGDLFLESEYGKYTASYDGIVDRIHIDGNKIELTLVNYEDRYLSLTVDTSYLQYFELGEEITFTSDRKEYVGTVSYVSSYAQDGNVNVEIEYVDDMELMLYSKASIVVVKEESEHCIAVPKASLIDNGGVDYLRIKGADGTPCLVEVQAGLEGDGNMVEILSGVNVDDVLLLNSSQMMLIEEESNGE